MRAPEEQEVQRLRDVYHAYDEQPAVRAKWARENPANRLAWEERWQVLGEVLHEAQLAPLSGRRVLDVGCGGGHIIAALTRWGAEPALLLGIDLLPARIEEARKLYPEVRFELANGERLDFSDRHFDLVLLFTVLSSVTDPGMARRIAGEVDRVLVPGGAIGWYDLRFPCPYNRHVRPVRRRDLYRLFPGYAQRLRTTTLLPPLGRLIGVPAPGLYRPLSRVPLLRTHYLGLLIKPEGVARVSTARLSGN